MAILQKIHSRAIQNNVSVLTAMKKMDEEHVRMLFVYEGDKFVSILTIGNIQRSIINGIDMSVPISAMVECDKVYANIHDSEEDVRKIMKRFRAECMPVLDDDGNLVDVFFWDDLFADVQIPESKKIQLPVVIMAGGKGTRLKPITNVIPKPLIPVGDKTIIEEIMDQFEGIGCKEFYISVNYKSDMIRFYLDHLNHKYNIKYFEEPKPLGTIGSVSLLKGSITTPFFVSNCDIIIEQDYRDVFEYHQSNHNDITIVTAVKSIRIPYGVIETGGDGLMTCIKEKPEQTYMINTGVYLLNPELIDEIPQGEIFHVTHLMEKVRTRGGRIGCFPVSEHSWRDMGEWPEYLKMIDVL